VKREEKRALGRLRLVLEDNVKVIQKTSVKKA
jgi:hypothetical protein